MALPVSILITGNPRMCQVDTEISVDHNVCVCEYVWDILMYFGSGLVAATQQV